MSKNNQKFLGLDLSLTGTGVCLINSDYSIIETKLIHNNSYNVQRLFLNKNDLINFLNDVGSVDYCCIEGPSFGSKDTGRLFQIGEWTGVVKLCLYEKNIPFFLAVPSQLKKYISGTGKDVKKELIMLDIYKKYNIEIRDNNIADAYVLSRIARDFTTYLHDVTTIDVLFKYQQDVIKALHKTYQLDTHNLLD